MTFTRILWNDAHDISPGEWIDTSPTDIGVTVETVGIIITETDDYILITHSIMRHNRSPRGAFAIPKVCIVSRVDVDQAPEGES